MENNNNASSDILELLKSVSLQDNSPSTKEPIKSNELERFVVDPRLRIMKTILPYLTISNKRMMATIIKLYELKKTMEIFDLSDTETTDILPHKQFDSVALLEELKNSLDESMQSKIDKAIMVLNLKKLLQEPQSSFIPELSPDILPSDTPATSQNNPMPFHSQKQPNHRNYNDFMHQMNKIINKKDGLNHG